MTPSPAFLPYGRQTVTDEDIAAVTAVLRGDFLTQGPVVGAFERAVADYVKAPYAIACASGTTGLQIAYHALDLQPGDAVIVPAITFLATASAAHWAGGRVFFCDVDPATGLAGVEHFQAAIDRVLAVGCRVRALAPVDLAGQPTAIEAIAALATRHGAVVIEDACHAIGTRHLNPTGSSRRVGAGDGATMTVFSFHPVKTIAAGEGGLVTTADPDLAHRLRCLANHGVVREPAAFHHPEQGQDHTGAPGPWYHEMPSPGFNARLSDIHAALALSQLGRIEAMIARRACLIDLYTERLAGFAPRIRLLDRVANAAPAWHLCVARIDFPAIGIGRTQLMADLRALGIGSQVHYIPVHRQPFWRTHTPTPTLPGADTYYRQALSLPLFPAMADGDVDRVVTALTRNL